MKTTFKLHPLYILVACICFITGYFRLFITTTLIVLFHELGHIFMMLILNIKIKEIILLPFGALIKTDDIINRKLIEEFFIAIMGPIFQIIYYHIFKCDYLKPIHYFLLAFNLLPIIPLDGSKIMGVLLNRFICFYKSEIIKVVISIVVIIVLNIIMHNFLIFIVSLFLIKEVINTYNNRNYLFNKFLMEHLYLNIHFKRHKIIKNKKEMFRDCNHIFNINGKYYTLKEYIKLT